MSSLSERAVIGATLVDANVLNLLDDVVTADDFSDGQYAALWTGIQTMRSRREAIDVLTVASNLAAWNVRNVTEADLHTMMSEVPHAMSARQYGQTVRADALRRRLRVIAAQLIADVDADPVTALSENMNRLRTVQDSHASKKFQVTTLETILDGEDTYDWVIPDLLERRDRLIITGSEGAGKSTLVRQLAVLASAGLHPFFFTSIAPVRVLVIDAENTEGQWRRAVRGMVKQAVKYGSHDPRDMVVLCTPRLDLTRDADLGQIHRIVDDIVPDIVVIGPLYRLIPRAINGDDEASPLLAALDTIRDRNCALIVEAHAGHALNQGGERDLRPRGSAALMGWPELGIGIRLPRAGAGGVHEITRWRGDRDKRDIPQGFVKGGDWPWTPVI